MNILHWHPPTLYMVHLDKTPYVLLTRRPKISIHFYSKIQMESPTVGKLDDLYYLFYSANHFKNIDYAVGYATSTSPYGPWKKHANNPIIHRSIVHENGSGHGDLFKGLDGRYYYVYHVHHSDSIVQPRKTRIVPLILKKENDVYSITIDKENVIKPMWK